MNKIAIVGMVLSFVLAGCAELRSFPADNPLEGGNLGDFVTTGEAVWQLEDGTLSPIRGEQNGYVYTKEVYASFEFSMDFYIESETNSGVYTHCMDAGTITPAACFEFNIWDENTNPANRTGSIVNISPPTVEVSTVNKWNTIRIRSEDGHQQIWVNDISTSDIQDTRYGTGHIALQYGGANGMVQFKNIVVRAL